MVRIQARANLSWLDGLKEQAFAGCSFHSRTEAAGNIWKVVDAEGIEGVGVAKLRTKVRRQHRSGGIHRLTHGGESSADWQSNHPNNVLGVWDEERDDQPPAQPDKCPDQEDDDANRDSGDRSTRAPPQRPDC